MGHHLTDRGTFKSDKYDWCPEGFFALKLKDPTAQICALLYAELTKEKELAQDLRAAVTNQRQQVNIVASPANLGAVFDVVKAARDHVHDGDAMADDPNYNCAICKAIRELDKV